MQIAGMYIVNVKNINRPVKEWYHSIFILTSLFLIIFKKFVFFIKNLHVWLLPVKNFFFFKKVAFARSGYLYHCTYTVGLLTSMEAVDPPRHWPCPTADCQDRFQPTLRPFYRSTWSFIPTFIVISSRVYYSTLYN